MEAILKVRRTQHGGYLGAPRAPAWLKPKIFEDLQRLLKQEAMLQLPLVYKTYF